LSTVHRLSGGPSATFPPRPQQQRVEGYVADGMPWNSALISDMICPRRCQRTSTIRHVALARRSNQERDQHENAFEDKERTGSSMDGMIRHDRCRCRSRDTERRVDGHVRILHHRSPSFSDRDVATGIYNLEDDPEDHRKAHCKSAIPNTSTITK
jgi:hypothetical protein